jgi:hypothetical protein
MKKVEPNVKLRQLLDFPIRYSKVMHLNCYMTVLCVLFLPSTTFHVVRCYTIVKLIAYNFGTIYERRTYNIIFFDVNIFILIIFTLQVSIQTEIGNKSVYDSGQLWGKLLIDIETFVGWLLVNEMSNCKIKLLYSLQIGIHFLPINMNEPFRNFATTNLVVNGL